MFYGCLVEAKPNLPFTQEELQPVGPIRFTSMQMSPAFCICVMWLPLSWLKKQASTGEMKHQRAKCIATQRQGRKFNLFTPEGQSWIQGRVEGPHHLEQQLSRLDYSTEFFLSPCLPRGQSSASVPISSHAKLVGEAGDERVTSTTYA